MGLNTRESPSHRVVYPQEICCTEVYYGKCVQILYNCIYVYILCIYIYNIILHKICIKTLHKYDVFIHI